MNRRHMSRKHMITMRNKKTQQPEIIHQRELTRVGWGFYFFVDSEMEAYKAAYVYRNTPHGVKVEYGHGSKKWMVTIFNKHAAEYEMDGAR